MRCFCCGTRLDTIKSPNVCDACSREIDRFDLAERAEHHRVLAQFAALVEALDIVLMAQMREDHARRAQSEAVR